MRPSLTSKKLLGLALFEDLLVVFFLLIFLTSALEILLPGILANKMPLAFLFTAFAFLLFAYSFWIKKMSLPYPTLQWPRAILFVLFVGLVTVTLFMNRAFGLLGDIFQLALLSLAIFCFWCTKE